MLQHLGTRNTSLMGDLGKSAGNMIQEYMLPSLFVLHFPSSSYHKISSFLQARGALECSQDGAIEADPKAQPLDLGQKVG